MKTETIYIKEVDKKLKFDKILINEGFNGRIPSGYIIDKVRPNLGATTLEIKTTRNSIIIEPFISVMEVKKEEFKSKLCIINEATSNKDIHDYLIHDCVSDKKLMTTPEAFERMISVLRIVDRNYRKNYFLLYDECEKIVQQAIFRPKLLVPLDEFFLFDEKALISATPLIPSDTRFEEHGFKLLIFKPDFDYQEDLKLITTNNLKTSLRNQLRLYDDGKPVFIYSNCKESILYATQIKEVQTDYKVFCAKDLDDKFFKHQKISNIQYSVEDQQYAKYNFFTSRFFSAVDMLYTDGTKPHVIMLTNIPWVKHSIIDPETEAIQIWGRLRAGISSITHITKLFINREPRSPIQIIADMELDITIIDRLKEVDLDFKNNVVQDVIGAITDKNLLNIVFENYTLNSYIQDAYRHKKLVENKYTSIEALKESYRQSNFFKVIHRDVKHPISDEDHIKIKRSSGKERRMSVGMALHNLETDYIKNNKPLDADYHKTIEDLKEMDALTVELYYLCGFDHLTDIRFNLSKMRKLYFELTIGKRTVAYANMVDEILIKFVLNTRIYSDDLKRSLQEIYDKYAYERDYETNHKAKAVDILRYFKGTFIEPKKPDPKRKYQTYYILYEPKHRLSNDLRILEKV
ncbi:hypothetical protein [Pedobacter gandavensis]|uniref:Uncharacterized protein n=1 Tax=Pedobacter gandavensis TaxID=2679963 RepID=A0ABR6F387_9SPHI|nr:hypothetical protein [Pedobacter gandavensis]MBB2151711.1 hypothetical protein [Pedobacter gandavensis]